MLLCIIFIFLRIGSLIGVECGMYLPIRAAVPPEVRPCELPEHFKFTLNPGHLHRIVEKTPSSFG